LGRQSPILAEFTGTVEMLSIHNLCQKVATSYPENPTTFSAHRTAEDVTT